MCKKKKKKKGERNKLTVIISIADDVLFHMSIIMVWIRLVLHPEGHSKVVR